MASLIAPSVGAYFPSLTLTAGSRWSGAACLAALPVARSCLSCSPHPCHPAPRLTPSLSPCSSGPLHHQSGTACAGDGGPRLVLGLDWEPSPPPTPALGRPRPRPHCRRWPLNRQGWNTLRRIERIQAGKWCRPCCCPSVWNGTVFLVWGLGGLLAGCYSVCLTVSFAECANEWQASWLEFVHTANCLMKVIIFFFFTF